jgi:hypothetical protein
MGDVLGASKFCVILHTALCFLLITHGALVKILENIPREAPFDEPTVALNRTL